VQVFDLPEPTIHPDALGFAPDGRLLAVSSHGQLFVIDTVGGGVRALWPDPDPFSPRGSGLAFTADGRNVIAHHCLDPHGAIEVHNIETGDVARDFPMAFSEVCEPGPGGRLIYVGAHPVRHHAIAEIVRWNPLTGETLPPFARHASVIQRLAVSADEKWVAGSNSEYIRVWNLGGKKLPARATRQFHIEHALVVSLALSADGAYVAAGSFFRNGGILHVGAVRTGAVWELGERPRSADRDLAFHPSRPVLALRGMSGAVALYDAEARTELKRYQWPLDLVTALAFSADGLRCAAAGPGKVVIWDVDV
jgi:WD40 repeat protein